MRPNPIRELHAAKQPIINAWLSIAAPYAAESVAHQGFDAVTIDCQHGMIGFDAAIAMLQAISSTRAAPMVRPSGLNPPEIMRFLDAGAYGVICPMISSAADARALVSACRYPPAGTRSFGPARGLLYGGSDYLAGANHEIVVLAMIETAEGLQAVDEIVTVPGLDGIYVGPNDLALALGHSPANESQVPEMIAAVGRIREATAAAGRICGIFCSDGAAAARRVAEGFDLVTPGNDAALLRATMARQVSLARGSDTP